MGLNRMMMRNGVKVEDGSKKWDYNETDAKTISFTVPPGIKRIKVTSSIDGGEGDPDLSNYANIKNTSTNKVWGEGWFYTTSEGEVDDAADIDSIVGVTPNKTYRLLFHCYYTSGVTFSWGQAINDMKPTVEDY
ncbi:hypothetical protein [Phascolarctobacterium succinatutens]|uniref:hypothetical protein n=1 Tax=Phascolarctobacterium succinatutens TaxID=626940 RepID=UPI003AB1FF2D